MKKLILLAVFAAMSFAAESAKAQTVKGVKISDITSPYLEVSEYRPLFSEKVCIRLEYGQKIIDWLDDALVKDDDGRNMDFDSALNFINKMKNYGYELLQVNVLNIAERPSKYYVLKRN